MRKSLLLISRPGPPAPNKKDSADLDGTNDYFSKASDFTSNSDSKIFTMVFWIYRDAAGALHTIYDANGKFTAQIDASNQVRIVGKNSASTTILDATVTVPTLLAKTFYPVLISLDLANASNRQVYIAEDSATVTWTTYTDDLIDFTETDHAIGALVGGTSKHSGKLAHFFLDYTLRDFSSSVQRRIFTEFGANGLQPTKTQAALNPIAYFKFDNQTSFITNSGTGGDMVQNGTMAQSYVGASDYSAEATQFDGTNDFLSRSSITGLSDGKEFTLSFDIKPGTPTATDVIFAARTLAFGAVFSVELNSGNQIVIQARNPATTQILSVAIDNIVYNRQYSIQIAIDLTDTNNRLILVDGVDPSPTWTTYTNDNIDFTVNDDWTVAGTVAAGAKIAADISSLWFDDSYLNLSGVNPFYDADQSRPKYLGETGELPSGSQPLVYLPLRPDQAGVNLGSDSDWTENSTPFVGARGPSEFIARGMLVDNSNYLSGSIFCQSLVKWLSVDSGVTWTPTYSNAVTVTDIGNGTDNGVVAYYFGTSENINWALEENKLRFTDAFGFPVPPVQDANTVLLMDFKDSSNLGRNQAGADFTITGTPAVGPDVTA